MYSPPAPIVTSQGGGNLGHLHEGQNAFLHAGPAAGAADQDQGEREPGRFLGGPRQLFADDGTHAAGHEGEIGDAEHDRPAANVAPADHRGVLHAGLGLLRFQSFAVQNAVGEAEHVLRLQLGEPFLEALFVEQLLDALARRQIEMVLALRTDVEAALGFLAKDGGLALRTANPQPFRNATFDSTWTCHGYLPVFQLPVSFAHSITFILSHSTSGVWSR